MECQIRNDVKWHEYSWSLTPFCPPSLSVLSLMDSRTTSASDRVLNLECAKYTDMTFWGNKRY